MDRRERDKSFCLGLSCLLSSGWSVVRGLQQDFLQCPNKGYDSSGGEGMCQCYMCNTKLSPLALLMISKDLEGAKDA